MTSDPQVIPDERLTRSRRGLDVAYFVTLVTLASPAVARLGLGTPVALRLIGWMTITAVVGFVCFRRVRLAGGAPTRAAVTGLVALTALTAGTVHASFGIGPSNMLFVPVAFLACLVLPTRASWAYVAALLVVDVGVFEVVDPSRGNELPYRVLTHSAALLFGAIFSHVLKREAVARAEVGRLNVELTGANDTLRRLAERSAETAAAQERNRLAREIHDGLGHSLTVVSMHLEAARRLLRDDATQAEEVIDRALALNRRGLEDVRRSVATLRDDRGVPEALPAAVEALAREASTGAYDVRFSCRGEPGELSPSMRLTLYRAAQEALTNVQRHAAAQNVWVDLDFDDESARLRVEDDGEGATSVAEAADCFGLIGVRERAHLLGGRLTAKTGDGGGFTFELEVPR